MAQAHIAIETARAAPSPWLRLAGRVAAFSAAVKERRSEKRAVARLLAERQAGIDSGARV